MWMTGRTQPLAPRPVAECLEILAAIGFSGVEICLENPDLQPSGLTAEKAAAIRTRLSDLGLSRNSASYHRDYIYDDAVLADTVKAVSLAPAFGAEIFVFSGTVARPDDRRPWERMLERTLELVAAAETGNVTLAIEFEPNFIVGSTADLHRLFEAIPSPRLRANLDLGHVFLCDPEPIKAIESLAGKVSHGHLENMRRGVHRHLPLHEGDMDIPAYLETLSATGFDGPLALDLYDGDYRELAVAALRFLRDSQVAFN